MSLDDIRSGEHVAVDTNILVYANRRKSEECVRFLKRCAVRDLHGIVPTAMVAELMHTLMLMEARENGWIGDSSPARSLAERPEQVRRLVAYERQMREFLGIGLRVEPVEAADFLEAMRMQRETGLLTNDALLLAVARRLGCTAVATADRAFAAAAGFAVHGPADIRP